MFKKATVVLLTTNQQSNIFLKSSGHLENNIYPPLHGVKSLGWEYKHLYIVSDEEIKEGDIILTKDYGVWEYRKAPCPLPYWGNKDGCKKLIATTNTQLDTKWKLPQPSQSFIDKYIIEYNKGNIITDIMVEYDQYIDLHKFKQGVKICSCIGNMHEIGKCEVTETSLKVNPKDNTITIKRIKDSWTREEVLLVCSLAYNEGENYGYESSPIEPDVHQYQRFDEWITNNL